MHAVVLDAVSIHADRGACLSLLLILTRWIDASGARVVKYRDVHDHRAWAGPFRHCHRHASGHDCGGDGFVHGDERTRCCATLEVPDRAATQAAAHALCPSHLPNPCPCPSLSPSHGAHHPTSNSPCAGAVPAHVEAAGTPHAATAPPSAAVPEVVVEGRTPGRSRAENCGRRGCRVGAVAPPWVRRGPRRVRPRGACLRWRRRGRLVRGRPARSGARACTRPWRGRTSLEGFEQGKRGRDLREVLVVACPVWAVRLQDVHTGY